MKYPAEKMFLSIRPQYVVCYCKPENRHLYLSLYRIDPYAVIFPLFWVTFSRLLKSSMKSNALLNL